MWAKDKHTQENATSSPTIAETKENLLCTPVRETWFPGKKKTVRQGRFCPTRTMNSCLDGVSGLDCSCFGTHRQQIPTATNHKGGVPIGRTELGWHRRVSAPAAGTRGLWHINVRQKNDRSRCTRTAPENRCGMENLNGLIQFHRLGGRCQCLPSDGVSRPPTQDKARGPKDGTGLR